MNSPHTHNTSGPQAASSSGWIRTLLGVGCLLWLLVAGPGCAGHRPKDKSLPTRTVRLLITSDVHGWINSDINKRTGQFQGGLAEMAGLWRAKEGYAPMPAEKAREAGWLLLDDGDMWTGPAESSLLEGGPMLEAYNYLGYSAATLGNHEFDFGLEALRRNAQALRFPLLAANLTSLPGGPQLDFCRPSVLLDVNGVKVGVVGLAFEGTPTVTLATYVAGIGFGPYLQPLRREAEALLAAGAEVLVVMAHEETAQLRLLAEQTADLPIRVFVGGHNHARELEILERDPSTKADDAILLNPGPMSRAYGRVVLQLQGRTLVAHEEGIVQVQGALAARAWTADATLSALGEQAKAVVAPRLKEVLGVAAEPLVIGTQDNSPLGQLIAQSWLEQFHQADFAITNLRGIRQPLETGPVTRGDVLSVLPFSNDLLEVSLTAAQLRQALEGELPMLLGGGTYQYRLEGTRRVVTALRDRQGRLVEENRSYRVITTDFLYLGGDGMAFKQQDPTPVYLGVSWRDPFMALIQRAGESGLRAPREPVARGLP